VALELVAEMQEKQVMPNQYTFSAAIRAVSETTLHKFYTVWVLIRDDD
jgi:hypothetical protein